MVRSTFDHVHFGYAPEKTIIHDFSCTSTPGQKVAIVGPTGAGKTTMVKLLMRFYDVDARRHHCWTATTSASLTRSDLREGFGMVLQDTWLFDGTIRGKHPPTAGWTPPTRRWWPRPRPRMVDHFIRTLPQRLRHRAERGSHQRLARARSSC